MYNIHSFLPGIRKQAAVLVLLYCIMGAFLNSSDGNQVEMKNTSVVYAQAKARSANVQISNAMTEEADTQILPDESVEAMQLGLAAEIAAQEKQKRELKAELEAKKIHLSKTDKNILLRIVEAEATGEDIKGKMLVANVVLNRVNSDKFPDSVEEVVFAKRQFSPIRDGRYYRVSITKETEEAVERVLNGEDESKGALYFMSRRQASSSNVRWFDRDLTWLLEYGTHEFFK